MFLPSLGGRKFRQQSQRHVTEALDLLALLVQQLSPDDDAIIVVIESACRLVEPSLKAGKALRCILKFAEKTPVVFKVLITDMISNRPIVTKLFVPDYIDGERQGLSFGMVQSETTASAAGFKSRDEDSPSVESCSSTSE